MIFDMMFLLALWGGPPEVLRPATETSEGRWTREVEWSEWMGRAVIPLYKEGEGGL